MDTAGEPVRPLVSRKPVGSAPVTPDMPRQAWLNMSAAGEPVRPDVSMKPVGSVVTLDMPLQAK